MFSASLLVENGFSSDILQSHTHLHLQFVSSMICSHPCFRSFFWPFQSSCLWRFIKVIYGSRASLVSFRKEKINLGLVSRLKPRFISDSKRVRGSPVNSLHSFRFHCKYNVLTCSQRLRPPVFPFSPLSLLRY